MFGRFTRDDTMLLGFALQEAADLGHPRLGTDHLILGMLCNARSPLFGVLTGLGLNLVTAREAVRTHHEEHDDTETGAADRYEQDREALRSIGINLDKVREAVRERFGDDLTDGWADRPGRGRGRDGRGDCGPRGRRGHGRGHGRRGGFGPGGPGWAPGAPGWDPRGFDGPGGGGPDAGWGPGFGPGWGPEDSGDEGPVEFGRGRRGPRGRGGRPRFSAAARQAFEAAVAIAPGRADRTLRAAYLLLGILEVADPAAIAVIESATTVDDLKAAVLASLPEATADAS
ncbi:MAG: Clp protease N-terminal domain-containing protein [Gordonia sp. (in: high G+C Gram-positive bacteria)]